MSFYILDTANWERKAHFEFFRDFDEPFFGVCVNLEVQQLYDHAKASGDSFFIHYLHAATKAANAVEAFRYRIDAEGNIRVYDVINASSTINREDGTFGFSYIAYADEFEVFRQSALHEIEQVRNNRDLIPSADDANTIHYSTLPWLQFTSLSHARRYSVKDSIPKITFGKLFRDNGRLNMPVSIHVHHALADGLHVGQFVDTLQQLMHMK